MSLDSEIKTVEEALETYRKLLKVNQPLEVRIPISSVEDVDPSDMVMKQGEWVEFDHWPGMRCMLTREDEDTHSSYILCHVTDEMDLRAHKHEGFGEELYMIEGVMEDVIHQQRITTGQRIKYPAGESHWPIFPGEAFFMVVFRKAATFKDREEDIVDDPEEIRKNYQVLETELKRLEQIAADYKSQEEKSG